jgi:hypothetical protein
MKTKDKEMIPWSAVTKRSSRVTSPSEAGVLRFALVTNWISSATIPAGDVTMTTGKLMIPLAHVLRFFPDSAAPGAVNS